MLDIEQFVAKKNALHGDAFVLLIEIEYASGEYIRWSRLNDRTDSAITFEGSTWAPFPIGNPKRSQNARGEIPTFDLAIANPQRIFQSILSNYIVEGKTGRLITVHRDHLDDPTAKAEEWFTIESASAHAGEITLTCRGVRFSPRRCRIPSKTMTRAEYPGLLGNSRHRFY
jgi:phage-related protein